MRTQSEIFVDILAEVSRHRKRMLELEVERVAGNDMVVTLGGRRYDLRKPTRVTALSTAMSKASNAFVKSLVAKANTQWEEEKQHVLSEMQ